MAISSGLKHPSVSTVFLLLLLFLSTNIFIHGASITGPIKTVVVLVMENRSFDHMLGWMKKLNPLIDGVDGSEWNPLNTTAAAATRIYFNDTSHYVVDPDPGHSFAAIREQIFGSDDDVTPSSVPPLMNGFAQQAYSVNGSIEMAQHVMNGFPPEMVAVYSALVSEFAVFDRWFASVPTSTQPNRMFVHSATSSGATSNNPLKLALGFPQRTIFDNLYDEGISFGIYYQDLPATLFFRNLRKLKYVSKFKSYDLSFQGDAMAGNLPAYTVIEQKWMDTKDDPATDDHPAHDVFQGQMFIKEVYETLRASPQWNETLLIITYDEHGGFYDHVPTPVQGVPSPDGIIGEDPYYFKFDRLGVRVPTIMVSPWIHKGTVINKANGPTPTSEYEHSSIPATVKKLFNLSSPFLTMRDAWAGTFEGILQMTEPRTDCPVQLPTPVKVRQGEANDDAQLSEFQQELMQLAAVLNGDSSLTSYPEMVSSTEMNVKQGRAYMRDAIKRFIEAGLAAKRMGLAGDQIIKMRPSLSSRSSKTPPPMS